jgi:5-methylcytosine-specific restriction endonuclease McrA
MMCRVVGCPQQVTLDHVIPKHNGGTLQPGNYVAACQRCNSERHPEMNALPKTAGPIVASTGEVQSESPFAKLKELVK